jgi:hypothetical protein
MAAAPIPAPSPPTTRRLQCAGTASSPPHLPKRPPPPELHHQ